MPISQRPRHPGQVRQPRKAVNRRRIRDEVGPGAARAHPGHLHVDDSRIGLAHGLVAHVPTSHHPGGKVVDHNVCGVRETTSQRTAFLMPHVQRDRALVAVPHEVVGRIVATSPLSGGRHDLHDIRAHVGEHARGERPRKDMGQVQYPHVLQRSHGRFVQPISDSTASVSEPTSPYGPIFQGVSLK